MINNSNSKANSKTVKSVCAIVKYNNKVCLEPNDSKDNEHLWKFPTVVVDPSEIVISALVKYINENFKIDIDTVDVNYFCNIKHKCETYFLDIDSFIVDINSLTIKDNILNTKNWFEIENLFNVPLTAEAVTLAQVLMEC